VAVNVCVIGTEAAALPACVRLQRAGYDVHTSQRSGPRLSMVRAADAVLFVAAPGDAGECDVLFIAYARELCKPVYRDLGQLLEQIPSTPVPLSRPPVRVIGGRRRKGKKHKKRKY
jgi:hypothetical protein